MSAKKFKFVSPGIFIDEIDNSFIPRGPQARGPVIIGRTERGPAMRPVTVSSFSEFIEIFGNPIPGGRAGDVWRDGNYVGPTYAAYAAQAYLRAGVGPVTMIRLLGHDHDSETTSEGDGAAGWKLGSGPTNVRSTNNGAYGLFLWNSGSFQTMDAIAAAKNASGNTIADDDYEPKRAPVSGTLAAVWYLTEGNIELSGVAGTSDLAVTGTAFLTPSIGASHEFRALVKDSNGDIIKQTTFNFDDTSDKYIRDVFNTNPQLTNTQFTQTSQVEKYWLGQSYDNFVRSHVSGTASGKSMAAILAIESGSTGWHDMKGSMQNAETGYFISQDLSSEYASFNAAEMQKLFKFVGLDHGAWIQNNLKISIQDIKKSTRPDSDLYGTFSVVVRRIEDTDNAPRIVERFSSCTLDPSSPDYIARKIGDQYYQWSDTERRLRIYGQYPNRSNFIRVVMNEDVDAGSTDPRYLPFGVHGPVRFSGWTYISGAAETVMLTSDHADGTAHPLDFIGLRFAKGHPDIPASYHLMADNSSDDGGGHGATVPFLFTGPQAAGQFGSEDPTETTWTGSVEYPRVPLRLSASDGAMSDPTNAYFGFQTTREASSTRYDRSIPDVLRPMPMGISSFVPVSSDIDSSTEYSYIFTLDDIITDTDKTQVAVWVSGSRVAGNSATTGGYARILTHGYDRFTSPFFGGFDGLDITEMEPFRNTRLDDGAANNELDNYAFNTVKRAIDSCADPEFVEYNLMVAPGITNEKLTQHMTNVCEDRGDALAIIDPKGGYVAVAENTDGEVSRRGSVTDVVNNMRDRGLNSSYACAYYPWVRIQDTINAQTLWMPPSVVALGTFASSQRKSELWFAPAGFNRGGLTEGSAGLPVVGVRERLTSSDRDELYAQNINPIASFPSEGIVIFGQKTLQMQRSSLDRINVRRLMIFLKKEVSRLATRVLFDQNVEATWNRFKALVDPFLASVRARFGITEYRLVLDESTTTPDLIDQNVLYAKILLKPARAIEFIAIDFVIANTGASFDD